MSNVVGNLVVGVTTDISGLQSGLAEAGASLRSAGSTITNIGAGITAGISLPLLAAGGAAVSFANDFNKQMANVASLGVPIEDVKAYKTAVQDLAISMGKSTDDLGNGLYQVISAFGQSSDSLKKLEINAKAAAGGQAETADAINLTSAVTKAYNDTSAEAVLKTSDWALTTVALGQTTFPELAGAIGSVTPLAAALGVKQEELFAVMATGTGVTGNASEVSTQFRGVLQSLMAPTDDMQNLIQKLGYSSGKAMIESLGLKGTITAITNEAIATNNPLQKYIGSIEGQTLAMQLSNGSATKFTENLTAMGNAAGATDAAFLAQTDGVNKLGFQWEQLKVKFSVIAQRIGDALIPILLKLSENITPIIDKIVDWVSKFETLDPAVQNNIFMIAGLVAGSGFLITAIGLVTSGIGILAGAFAFVTAPMLLVGVAVAALAYAWYTNFGGIQEKTQMVIDFIKPYFYSLVEYIQSIPTSLSEMVKGWSEKWDTISEKTSVISELLTTGFTDLVLWFDEKFPNALNILSTGFEYAWLGISLIINTEIANITKAFDEIKKWFDTTFPNAYESLKTNTDTAWKEIKKFISDPISGILDAIISLEDKIIKGIPDAFTSLKTFLSSFTFSNPFSKLTEWLQPILDKIQYLKDLLASLPGGITGGKSKSAIDSVKVNTVNGSVQPVSNNQNITVNVNVEKIDNSIDVESLAYRVSDIVKRNR